MARYAAGIPIKGPSFCPLIQGSLKGSMRVLKGFYEGIVRWDLASQVMNALIGLLEISSRVTLVYLI